MRRRRKPKGLPSYPEIVSDKIQTVTLVCVICGTPTGKTEDWRRSDVDCAIAFDSQDPKAWLARKGLCANCQKQKDEGCVLMFSDTRGVILNPEAAKKLKPEFRDVVLKIPESEMDKVYKPDTDNTTETN